MKAQMGTQSIVAQPLQANTALKAVQDRLKSFLLHVDCDDRDLFYI